MLAQRCPVLKGYTTLLSFSYKTAQKVDTFKQRIKNFNFKLDRYQRQFHMRPPNLETKQSITFPITVPFLVRHRHIPSRKRQQFVDNSSRIHWNRLTPNQILLGFQNIQYLEYNEIVEGLRYLSEVKEQVDHNWNTHPWVSKALEVVNSNFLRIKKGDHLSMYYLMKKLRYQNQAFWSRMYAHIEENIYDLPSNEFENFFLRYYKDSNRYFSTEMKEKFLTLMENRLRSFSPSGIISVYEIFQQEDRLDDYWKYNVFIPLFKNDQYNYRPQQLFKILKHMLVIDHEKDDRLYASLYKRLMSYETMTLLQLKKLQEVIYEIKDLFISHRVDPYIAHLKELKTKIKKDRKINKKEIPIHELVKKDLSFYLAKKQLEKQTIAEENPQQ